MFHFLKKLDYIFLLLPVCCMVLLWMYYDRRVDLCGNSDRTVEEEEHGLWGCKRRRWRYVGAALKKLCNSLWSLLLYWKKKNVWDWFWPETLAEWETFNSIEIWLYLLVEVACIRFDHTPLILISSCLANLLLSLPLLKR